MIISKCPSCHESVTVPDAPRQARVRCPLCQEQYTVGDVLERCPPALELLDAPSSGSALDEHYSELAPIGAAAEMEMEAEAAPSFDFHEAPAPKAAAVSTPAATPKMSTSARRARRKPKNPVIEIVKVVGGGVVGLFIAQMILWWMPFNLQIGQRDPFSLGRSIGEYVPWIVPAEVRGASSSSAQSPAAGNQSQNASKSGSRSGGTSRQSAQPTSLAGRQNNAGQFGNERAGTGAGQGSPSQLVSDPTESSGNGTDEFPLLDTRPAEEPGNSQSNPPTLEPGGLDIDVPSPGPSSPAPPRQGSGFKSAADRSADDVSAAIEAVRTTNTAYDDAQSASIAERVALAKSLYAALAELGAVLAHTEMSKPAGVQSRLLELGELITSLGPNKHAGLGALAAGWLEDDQRENDGVVLVGTVKAVAPLEGDYYECRIEQGGKIYPVLGWIPQPRLRVGAKVLVLGAIVDDPAAQLVNYTGSGGQVFCGVYSQVLKDAPGSGSPTGSKPGNGGPAGNKRADEKPADEKPADVEPGGAN